MPRVLYKFPLTRWIRGTIDKMNRFGKHDIQSWHYHWLGTYKELGGKSEESGKKGCPAHAAYGLWSLGRIKETKIPYQQKSIRFIRQEYGKNAAYAELALNLLEKREAAKNIESLWIQVQELYRRDINEEPAKNQQQGAITVAVTLFEEGQIVADYE
jgi:hypothetical protein